MVELQKNNKERQSSRVILVFLIFCNILFSIAALSAQADSIQFVDTAISHDHYGPNHNWVFSDRVDKVITFSKTSGYGINEVQLWDFEKQHIIKRIDIDCYAIKNVFFGKDDQTFFVLGEKNVQEFDVYTGDLIYTYQGEARELSRRLSPYVQLSPDKQKLVLFNNSVDFEIWDTQSRKKIHSLLSPQLISGENRLRFSPDSRYLLVNYKDKLIRVWDLNQGNIIQSVKSTSNLEMFSLSYDNQQLAVGGQNSTLKIYDLQSGTLLKEFKEYRLSYFNSLSFSMDGKYILSGCRDATFLWDLSVDKLVFKDYNRSGSGAGAFFYDKDQYLVAPKVKSNEDYFFHLYAIEDLPFYKTKEENLQEAENLSDIDPLNTKLEMPEVHEVVPISPLNKYQSIRIKEARIALRGQVWDLLNDKISHSFYNEFRSFGLRQFSSKENKILLKIANKKMRHENRWLNLNTGILSKPFHHHIIGEGAINKKAVFVARPPEINKYKKGIIQLIDANSGALIRELAPFPNNKEEITVARVRFLENGAKLLLETFGYKYTSFHIYDMATNKVEPVDTDLNFESINTMDALTVSFSEKYFASPNINRQVVVFNTNTLEVIFELPVDGFSAVIPFFSHDEELLVSSGSYGTLSICDFKEKKQELRTFDGHDPVLHPTENQFMFISKNKKQLETVNFIDYLETSKSIKFDSEITLHSYSLNGNYIYVVLKNGFLLKIDAKSLEVVQQAPVAKEGIKMKIKMIEADSFLIIQNIEGVHFFDGNTLEQLFSYYLFEKEDWVLISKTGHFDGSAGALRKMYYSNGQESKTLNEFPAEFRIKNLMQKHLAGEKIDDIDVGNVFE